MKRSKKSIRVYAPATVSNLACGFDIFGLAIDEPGDSVELIPNDRRELRIVRISGDKGKLSTDPGRNTVTVSIAAMLAFLGADQGFDIILKKQMPLGSGLGSSAASGAAGVVALNEWMGRPFDRKELVRFAMEGERIACGSAHPDNVAPCIMGGIVLCHPSGEMIPLPVPAGMHLVVLHPHVELLTRDSRAALPKKIPLHIAVRQWANTAALTSSFYKSDFRRMREAMQDFVAEPARAPLIPGFTQIKEAAMHEAVACSISGSGPSVFAVATNAAAAQRIGTAMKKACTRQGIRSDLFISKVNKSGAKLIR